ncbi:MAG: PAS domain-containing protein, partial [Myxococcota bacterium]
IYLEPALQKQATSIFHYALNSGGHLFLGGSESLATSPELFRMLDKRHRILQRADAPARPVLPMAPAVEAESARPEPPVARASAIAERRSTLQKNLEQIVLEEFAPSWVVIDRRGETILFSNRTGRYLEHPSGAPRADLVGLAREGLRLPLRGAIHEATTDNRQVVHERVPLTIDGRVQELRLVVRPLPRTPDTPDLFMVLFQERAATRARRPSDGDRDMTAAAARITQQLESELTITREQLQATIEQVQSTNEELRSSNEELQSANEELQSTNEELQTSKEEIQSINEELETINAELEHKVEELDRANGDLQNLFQSTRIPTLFLDRELKVKRYTEAATELFRLIPADLGRPLTDIATALSVDELVDDVRAVMRSLAPHERRMKRRDAATTHVVRVLPYRRQDGQFDGVVVTFTDVTELERALDSARRLADIVESSQDAIVGCTLDGVIQVWNQGAVELLGYAAAEVVGQPFSLLVPSDQREQAEAARERLTRGEVLPA